MQFLKFSQIYREYTNRRVWWLCLIQQKEVDRLKLEWNVFVEDWNRNEIKTFNIFKHGRFLEDVKKSLKKFDNKEDFAEELRKDLAYYYWGKCEWETIITSFPTRITKEELDRLNKEFKKDSERYEHEPYSMWISPTVYKKVDVYEQIRLNWDIFVGYVWSHKRSKK